MSQAELANQEDESLLAPRPYQGSQTRDAIDAPKDEEATVEQEPEVDPNDAEEVTFKKRYGDLRRYTSEQVDTLQTQITELEARLEASEQGSVEEDEVNEEMDAFAIQHPDAYSVLQQLTKEETKEQAERIRALEEELTTNREESATENAELVIMGEHSDWNDIRSSDEFHEWVAEQPAPIQAGVYDNPDDGEFAAYIIGMYKRQKGLVKKASKTDEDAMKLSVRSRAGSPDQREKPSFTRTQIQKMSLKDYERHEKDILAAQREGRIDNR